MKLIIEVELVDGNCNDCDLDHVCDCAETPCLYPNKCYKVIKVEQN